MVIFLTCAPEEQLGYDTTMHRFRNSVGQYQFVIDVGLLSNFAADSLLGRGTRVWSGSFEDGTPAVLKDCWVECDRKLEGDILATLREEYAKLTAPNKPNFDNHFLRVIVHSKTQLAGGAEDDTQEMMNGEVPVTDNWLDVVECNYKLQRSHPHEAEYIVRHAFKRRCHYRISFREVATPLYKVVNLQDHMAALRDTITAIGILHRLGYVHRDISSGNILFHEGRGRLSDLEFCRPFSEPGAHDVRAVGHFS
ncbi:hypothetical protein BD779DRAFT_1563813 [Infundibulicybe gibba]|nr:hypothetical protein BD779DRAFT_1563813 [Infundibulicybe gibba]